MDAFVVKLPRGQAGDGGSAEGKRPRLEGPGPERPPPREIRAEGLSCDYRILFSKAEADEIFQELEKEVEYFEGIFLPCEGARAVQGGSGGLPKAWTVLLDTLLGQEGGLGDPHWSLPASNLLCPAVFPSIPLFPVKHFPVSPFR